MNINDIVKRSIKLVDAPLSESLKKDINANYIYLGRDSREFNYYQKRNTEDVYRLNDMYANCFLEKITYYK